MTKSSISKLAAQRRRGGRKSTSKVVAESAHGKHRRTNHIAEKAQTRRNSPRAIPVWEVSKFAAQFEQFGDTQVPETMRAFAERNVAQTRELYERSKNTLQSVLESWQNSFGTAGQGVMALNQKIIDIAERNIDSGLDLAMNLCRAKNLSEVIELQAAYWQNQLSELKTEAEAVRALSTKVHMNTGIRRRNH